MEKVPVRWTYERTEDGYSARFSAERSVLIDRMRIGPFPKDARLACTLPFTTRVLGDGRLFADVRFGCRLAEAEVLVSVR